MILPLRVFVLGLLYEGLRVVLHSVIGQTSPRCEPRHCDEIMRTKILGDGVPDRHTNSGLNLGEEPLAPASGTSGCFGEGGTRRR